MNNKQNISGSRTNKVAKNVSVSLCCQVIAMLLQFLCRVVFVRTLGKEYLGVSGLFTNILTVLSFAELGVGGAIVFQLYKPLAQGDREKIKSLMALYKRAYWLIGTVIGVGGLMLIPFLKFIVKTELAIQENLYVIYLLYLFNTVSSYFLSYKKSIIIADQQIYLVNLYTQALSILQVFAQAIVLICFKNYIFYLLIQIIFTVLVNVLISLRADKMYPELREKAQPLPKTERQSIYANVRALAVYKIGSTVLNGTDGILVSAMFSVSDVGLVSNYLMLNHAFSTVLGKVTESFTASIGNLNACSDAEQQYYVFREVFFLCAWLFGYVSIGMMLLAEPVITIIFGAEYRISIMVQLALVVSFYVSSMQYAAFSYRTTTGLFRNARAVPACAALLNIALSVFLGKHIGLSGIYFATAISRFCTITVTDGYLVYRKIFAKNPIRYFVGYFGFAGLFAGLYLVIKQAVQLITIGGSWEIIIKIVLVTLLYHIIMIGLFFKTREFQSLFGRVCRLLFHRK